MESNLSRLQDNNRIIIALDFDNQLAADQLINQLDPQECRLKIGKEMFTYFGPQWVSSLVARGFDIFLDLKFHDIPNTVHKACTAAAKLGVWMINVHASGGFEMMQQARAAIQAHSGKKPLLTAVTVLTSMDQSQFSAIVDNLSIQEQVKRLALLAQEAQLDGVVCSAQEAVLLRQCVEPEFLLVSPGIRPIGSASGDQKRIVTPDQALKNGVDYLVIGRPITASDDPVEALKSINASIRKLIA